MNEQWLDAAERYAQYSKKFGLPTDKLREWIELGRELRNFFWSDEGIASMALLATSEKFIIMVRTEDAKEVMVIGAADAEAHGQAQSVAYGWGPNGPSKIILSHFFGIPMPVPVYPLELAKALLKGGKNRTEALAYLRAELIAIAEHAPAKIET